MAMGQCDICGKHGKEHVGINVLYLRGYPACNDTKIKETPQYTTVEHVSRRRWAM